MGIDLDEISLVGAVTLLMCAQLGYCAHKVKEFRTKLKIAPNVMSGPPEFERSLRAQQDTLEFFMIALPMLWVSGIYFNQVVAAGIGAAYLFARHEYITGYLKTAEDKFPDQKLTVRVLYALLATAAIGVAVCFFEQLTGIRLMRLLTRRRKN